MKRFLVVLILMLFTLGVNTYASEIYGGEPEMVTVTATTLVPGTWTLLQGTKWSTNQSLFWRRVFFSEQSGNYSFRYTFNPVSYTVVDDYTTVPLQARESWKISAPNGVYGSTIWTTGAGVVIETTTTK